MTGASRVPSDPSRASTWMRDLVRVHGVDGARDVLESTLVRLTLPELAALNFHWPLWVRSKQRLPSDGWRVCLLLAGRSWGKTRAVNEWLQGEVMGARVERFLLIGRTDDEVLRTLVKGKDSGLEAIAPPWFRPRVYTGDPPKIVYPNGATGYLASAEQPDSVRGENLDALVWDEVAAAEPGRAKEVFYNARMALRGRVGARLLMSTTSRKKRPIMREIRDKAIEDPARYRIVHGSTLENRAYLPADYVADMISDYVGTALGAQELEGQILDESESEGAIWHAAWFKRASRAPELVRVVVAVDPAVSSRAGSDETGIVAAGIDARGVVYVLADRSGRYTADKWPRLVWELAHELGASLVVVETNRGGNLVARALYDERRTEGEKPGRHRLKDVGVKEVRAEHQKEVRADPVTRLYERGLVVHVGELDALEQQQLTWEPLLRKSPDRIDALVWAVWELAGARVFASDESARGPSMPDFYEAASRGIDPYASLEAVMGRR